MESKDLVSVVIPTYNRSKVLLKAVKSVLNQTYRNIELIVVDDGSTDDTLEVLQEVNDKRLKIIHQNNKGACAARNNGIEHAKGEYIAFNDSDDEWTSKKLEEQLIVAQSKNPDIIFTKINMKQDGVFKKIESEYKNGFLNPVTNVLGITTQSLMFKKEVLKNNRFDESLPRYQEFELLLRIAKKYTIYCLDKGLVNKNISEDAISNNPIKLEKTIGIILKKYPNLKIEFPKIYSELENNLYIEAKSALKRGDKKTARILLDKTLAFKSNKGKYLYKYLRNQVFLIGTPIISKIYSNKM